MNCINRFETSFRPTMHTAFPMVYRILQNLEEISDGKEVWRGEGKPLAYPSVYSRELCEVAQQKLMQKSWYHLLLLVGCYLNPLFQEMEFIEETVHRAELRSKAEEFAKRLVRKHKPMERTAYAHVNTRFRNGASSSGEVEEVSIDKSGSQSRVGGKKRSFDEFKCADKVPNRKQTLDEVSKYNMASIDCIRQTQKEFLEDEFPVLKFWYN